MDLGMKMMFKTLFGLDVDQIAPMVEQLKQDLPKIIGFVQSVDARLNSIQAQLAQMQAAAQEEEGFINARTDCKSAAA